MAKVVSGVPSFGSRPTELTTSGFNLKKKTQQLAMVDFKHQKSWFYGYQSGLKHQAFQKPKGKISSRMFTPRISQTFLFVAFWPDDGSVLNRFVLTPLNGAMIKSPVLQELQKTPRARRWLECCVLPGWVAIAHQRFPEAWLLANGAEPMWGAIFKFICQRKTKDSKWLERIEGIWIWSDMKWYEVLEKVFKGVNFVRVQRC